MAQPAAPHYSFPIMPLPEMVPLLAELGQDVSVEQLTKPEPDQVSKMFEELVKRLVGVSRRALELRRHSHC